MTSRPSSVVAGLRSQGISVTLDPGGKLVANTNGRLSDEAKVQLRTHKQDIIRELWSESNAALLVSLPDKASGPAMSQVKYGELRDYIGQPGPAALSSHEGSGAIVGVTAPNDVLPAGAVTILLEDGQRMDCDSRMLRYPDGEPVADVMWSVAEPSTEDLNADAERYTGHFLWVATDLDSFEDTDSRLGYEVECDGVYRMLDGPYYAWLRSHMEKAKKARDAGSLEDAAFETLRERFNVIHSWAIENLGEEALQAGIRGTSLKTYVAPSLETYAAYRKAQDDAWDAKKRQPASPATPDGLTGYAPELEQMLATQGYAAIRSSVIGKVVVVTSDESVVVPPEWAKAVTFTMAEIGLLKGAGADMIRQVYEVKRRFGGDVVPITPSDNRIFPDDPPVADDSQLALGCSG